MEQFNLCLDPLLYGKTLNIVSALSKRVFVKEPGRIAQLVVRLTISEVRYLVQPHTFVSSSADLRRAVVCALNNS